MFGHSLFRLTFGLFQSTFSTNRLQCDLACGLSSINQLIKLIDMPAKGCDILRSALMSTVIDYPQMVRTLVCLLFCNCTINIFCYDLLQCWEEMTAAGLNSLNYIGPLRKNKNATIDEDPTLDVAPFEFDRFKRHLNGLLDRVSRMITTNGEQKPNDVDETLAEEDDNATDASELPKTTRAEESDWIFDVKKNMDVLPRLQHHPDVDSGSSTRASFSKD